MIGQLTLPDVLQHPRPGNALFGLTCLHAPSNAAGAVLVGAGSLSSPLALLGIGLWVDPAQQPFLLLGTSSNALGRSTLPLPIPSGFPTGITFYTQFIWAETSTTPPCPPLGLSASSGMGITIQP